MKKTRARRLGTFGPQRTPMNLGDSLDDGQAQSTSPGNRSGPESQHPVVETSRGN